VCAVQVDGSSGNKFQSVAELVATEKAARAARRGGVGTVAVSEEETVRGCCTCPVEAAQLRLTICRDQRHLCIVQGPACSLDHHMPAMRLPSGIKALLLCLTSQRSSIIATLTHCCTAAKVTAAPKALSPLLERLFADSRSRLFAPCSAAASCVPESHAFSLKSTNPDTLLYGHAGDCSHQGAKPPAGVAAC
jgi:hypothetical protein